MYKSCEKSGKESESGRHGATPEAAPTYTVEEAIDHIGFGHFQLRVFSICASIAMSDALELKLVAVLSPVVKCEWDLSDTQEASITAGVFAGTLVGTIVFGVLADRYGRLMIVRLATLWITYFGLLTAGSPGYNWLIFLRALVGFGVGGAIQSFTLLGEYVPSKYRATSLILYQTISGLGAVSECLLAAVILPNFSWRWQVGISALPTLLGFGATFSMPESARYLLAAGRQQEAEAVLARAAALNRTNLPEGHLVQSGEVERGRILDLFSPGYLRTTLLMLAMWLCSYICYYGVIVLGSVIFVGYCDTEVDTKDSETERCILYTSQDYLLLAVANMGEFAAIGINLVTVDYLGRRSSMGLLSLANTVFTFLLLICGGYTWLTVVSFLLRTFTSGSTGVDYIYTTEVYPTTIRSIGLGVNNAAARVGSMITPFIGQTLFLHSPTLAICVYGLVSALCVMFSVLLPIETKNRPLQQTASHCS